MIDLEVTISIQNCVRRWRKKLLIPKDIVWNLSLLLHGAIHNNVFNEETLSGKGSTHVPSTVIYQENNIIEKSINLFKLKPTAEKFEYDLKENEPDSILSKANVYSGNSLRSILKGIQYNRGIT